MLLLVFVTLEKCFVKDMCYITYKVLKFLWYSLTVSFSAWMNLPYTYLGHFFPTRESFRGELSLWRLHVYDVTTMVRVESRVKC